jgi:hypothetical protein
MLTTIFLVIACVCFLLAAASVPSRLNLVALGLFFWCVTTLLPALHAAA